MSTRIKAELSPSFLFIFLRHRFRYQFVDLPRMKQTVKEYLSDLLIPTDEGQAFLRDFANKRYSPEKLFSVIVFAPPDG